MLTNPMKIFINIYMEIFEQIPFSVFIPRELKILLVFYIQMLDESPMSNFDLIFILSDSYRMLLLRSEFEKKSYDFDFAADLILTAFEKNRHDISFEIIDCLFNHAVITKSLKEIVLYCVEEICGGSFVNKDEMRKMYDTNH
jgi:hypothetical protein